MRIIYDIALRCYLMVARVIAPFNKKAALWSGGQKGVINRIARSLEGNTSPVAWFHAASLGEFEQGRAVIEQFRLSYPNYKILVTFFSPSGYEVRKDYSGADYIFYLPIDTIVNSRRFLDVVKPQMALFIKYEFWPNYLHELRKRGVKTYVISAIFRESQLFFKPYGVLYSKVLGNFTHLFVQDNHSKELLATVGITSVTVCGDTRFDRVYQIAKGGDEIELFKNFSQNSTTFIVGSSWPEDDAIALELMANFSDIKFIVAPHELGEAKIVKLCSDITALGRKVVRYTSIDKQSGGLVDDCSVIVVDTIGILSKIYRYGHYAFIGGGFGVGIHNTLEAATFGLPIIIGPNYQRFAEAVSLVEIGAITPIASAAQAVEWLQKLEGNSELYTNSQQGCLRYVESNVGACNTIISHPLV